MCQSDNENTGLSVYNFTEKWGIKPLHQHFIDFVLCCLQAHANVLDFSFALFGSSYKGHYSECKMGFVIPKVKKDSTFRIFAKVRYSEFPKGSNIPKNCGKGLILQNGVPCLLF